MDISFVCRNRTYGNYSPVLNGHIAQDLLSSAVLLHETDACPALRQNKRDREEEKESFFKGLHSGGMYTYMSKLCLSLEGPHILCLEIRLQKKQCFYLFYLSILTKLQRTILYCQNKIILYIYIYLCDNTTVKIVKHTFMRNI